MAKWMALRKYANDYQCAFCGAKACNPSVVFRVNAAKVGGIFRSVVHCPRCSNGHATCPGCQNVINPTKQHSGGLRHLPTGGWLWNSECDPRCKTILALGLGSNTAPRPTAMTPPPSQPTPKQTAVPVVIPASQIPDEKRERLALKLKYRILSGLHTMKAQGHDINTVVVLDLDQRDDLVQECGVCKGKLIIRLGEFDSPEFTGTGVAFPCNRLSRSVKP